jgi:hypothetical protein
MTIIEAVQYVGPAGTVRIADVLVVPGQVVSGPASLVESLAQSTDLWRIVTGAPEGLTTEEGE